VAAGREADHDIAVGVGVELMIPPITPPS